MLGIFNWAHWADFADDYNTAYESHYVMCSKCGDIAIETHMNCDTYKAYIGDTVVADNVPIGELEIGVCRLPRKCKCGAHMARRNREYDMLLPKVNDDEPYPTFVLVQP